MSTWLITGCSTGLGRALAEAVIGAGHNAVVTARDAAKVADLADAAPERVLAAALDVTEPEQVASAVQQAEERFGGIDVLVNNAGYGYRAAVEEGDDAEVRTLFETHFFGTVAMIKAVLPGMRARRSGAIVNLSSIGATADPGRIRLLRGGQSRRRRHQRSASRRARPARHLGDRRRARRVSHRLRRPLARPIGHGHRRLREHRRAAPQRERHHARQPGRRPRQGRRGDHRGRRINRAPRFLLLGPDALAAYRYIADATRRARSPSGRSSPRAPTSIPDTGFRSATNARTMEGSADLTGSHRSRRERAMNSRSRRLPPWLKAQPRNDMISTRRSSRCAPPTVRRRTWCVGW